MPNYGGFAMPGEDFFLFSSMYHDKLLTEFLPVIKNRSYQRYMQIQKNILNMNEISGSLAPNDKFKYSFKESLELSTYFEFPVGSIFLDVTGQEFFMDISDKLAYIKKYGNYITPVSSIDILMNPNIFANCIRCMIGDFFFNKFYFLQDKYHRTFIGIKNSSSDGIPTNVIKRLINDGTEDEPTTFCFWKEPSSAAYIYNGNFSSIIFNTTKPNTKRINIPKAGRINSIYHGHQNNWSITVSHDSIRYGSLLYSTTNAELVAETDKDLVFDISSAYVADILKRNTVVSCIAIQRPYRKAVYAYTPNAGTDAPWLALGEINHPISISNIKIYKFDEATNVYKKRIPIEASNFAMEFDKKVKYEEYNENNFFTDIIFPAIYKFSNLTTPVRMELIEFETKITNTTFDNHLLPLFETVDVDGNRTYSLQAYMDYLTWLSNNTEHPVYGTKVSEALGKLTKYNPCSIYMDYTDYRRLNLPLREYKFAKLMQLIASDPYLYAEYVKFMDRENYKILIESGSPKKFKVNTGLYGDLGSNIPTVNDDGFTCINKQDETYKFDKPHTYIKVRSENPDAFCMVYVGGRLVVPTRIKSKLNDIYLFFPQADMKAYVEKAMELFKDRPDLNVNNLITVELYNNIYRSNINRIHSSFTYSSIADSFKLFGGTDDVHYRISELVIYNKITGEIIPLSKFDITAELSQATVEFSDEDKDAVTGNIADIIYLGTVLGEFYTTKDKLKLILNEDRQDYGFPDTPGITGGKSDNYKGYQHKLWSANELKFKINDPQLIGTEIEFVYNPIGYTWDFTIDQFGRNDMGDYSLKLNTGIVNNDLNRFELYVNGEFLPTVALNGDIRLKISNSVTSNSLSEIILPNYISTWYGEGISTIQLRYKPLPHIYQQGVAKYLLTDKLFGVATEEINNVSATDATYYEGVESGIYFNSETSKAFITKADNSITTFLHRTYMWKVRKETIDLQTLTNVSYNYPIYNPNGEEFPLLVSVHRDNSFITLPKASNASSLIDQILTPILD